MALIKGKVTAILQGSKPWRVVVPSGLQDVPNDFVHD
jgi:hypothetical protein